MQGIRGSLMLVAEFRACASPSRVTRFSRILDIPTGPSYSQQDTSHKFRKERLSSGHGRL
jgi:hypothetical protein